MISGKSAITCYYFYNMGLEQLDMFASLTKEAPLDQNEIFSNRMIKVRLKSRKNPVIPNEVPLNTLPVSAAIPDLEKTNSFTKPANIYHTVPAQEQVPLQPALSVTDKDTTAQKEPVQYANASDKLIKTETQLTETVSKESKVDAIEPKDEDLNSTTTGNKRGRKSYKEIYTNVDLINIPAEELLQQKLYYSISEVAGWFNVTTSQIRFWENEFDILQPRKNRKGDRLFRVEDIKNLQLIYYLVRNRKFSLEGAKEYIKANKDKAQVQQQLVETLTKFRSFLLELKTNLAS
jgi:DNA-binding transcriptional MerR regulator